MIICRVLQEVNGGGREGAGWRGRGRSEEALEGFLGGWSTEQGMQIERGWRVSWQVAPRRVVLMEEKREGRRRGKGERGYYRGSFIQEEGEGKATIYNLNYTL